MDSLLPKLQKISFYLCVFNVNSANTICLCNKLPEDKNVFFWFIFYIVTIPGYLSISDQEILQIYRLNFHVFILVHV